jgi:hypothetical protein
MTPARWPRLLATGATLGVVSLAIFAGLHSLVVKPIWTQLLGGLPFVLAIGVTVTWAYDEFLAAAAGTRGAGGMRFGAMMWLASLPAVAFASVMRVQLGGPLPVWSEIVAGLLALGGGAGIMAAVTRRSPQAWHRWRCWREAAARCPSSVVAGWPSSGSGSSCSK